MGLRKSTDAKSWSWAWVLDVALRIDVAQWGEGCGMLGYKGGIHKVLHQRRARRLEECMMCKSATCSSPSKKMFNFKYRSQSWMSADQRIVTALAAADKLEEGFYTFAQPLAVGAHS
jgi:hypothetical protein